MRTFRTQFIRLLLALLILPAQALVADGKAASAAKAGGKHFLWKVTSTDGEGVVYLLGSVHAAKKDLYPLSEAIEKAFKESDTLALEIHLTKKAEMNAAFKLAAAARYPAGDSLEKHIDKELKEKLDAELKKSGIPAGALGQFKPWMVSIVLSMQALAKEGFSPQFGIDRHFQQRAEEAKKTIVSLESVETQVELFNDLSDELGVKMLKQTLEEIDEVGRQMEEGFEAWKRGDAEALDKLLMKEMRTEEYRPLFQKVFVDRNMAMTKKIEEFLKKDGTVFVVVGAGHLIGEKGIIDLLRAKRNYRIEQL